jgi:cell division GTPase FtsZ
LSAGDRKLTEFSYAEPGYGRKAAVVGIGSAGCRIACQLSIQSRLLEHFLYVTSDEHDIANVTQGEKVIIEGDQAPRGSPFSVRAALRARLPEIKRHIVDSQIVFLICGLGGTVGSGIGPVIAREAAERNAIVISILVMPYSFERSKHYFAGIALKQMRRFSSGVILIDNDELLQEELPAIDAFAMVNQRIALALNEILGSGYNHDFSIGMKNVVNFVRTKSYSVLCLGESGNECRRAVLNAAQHFDKTVDRKEASGTIVHLNSVKSITMNEVVRSIGGLSSVLGNGEMPIEYGFSTNSGSTTIAIIIATGFSRTRFDAYDPVDSAMKGYAKSVDTEMDEGSDVQLLLSNLESHD